MYSNEQSLKEVIQELLKAINWMIKCPKHKSLLHGKPWWVR